MLSKTNQTGRRSAPQKSSIVADVLLGVFYE